MTRDTGLTLALGEPGKRACARYGTPATSGISTDLEGATSPAGLSRSTHQHLAVARVWLDAKVMSPLTLSVSF